MSVLLPSSTLPAVMKRRTPRSSITGGRASISPSGAILEVPFLLAALHRRFRRLVARARRGDHGDRDEKTVPAHDAAPVRVVDRGDGEPLALDVLPHVELGPVADGEHAHMLALRHAGVVEAPQLGALVLRIPLSELVAEREDALLRPRLLLVAARPADRGVERELGDRLEERHRLRRVA